MTQHQERLTLSLQESLLLDEICKRFGWSKSKALQIMFFEFCEVWPRPQGPQHGLMNNANAFWN